jgi:hypothetical protein
MRTGLLGAGLAALTLCGADAASAFIAANTIDRHATYRQDGAQARASGPIGCVTATRKWCERVRLSGGF